MNTGIVYQAYTILEQIRITNMYSFFKVAYQKGYEFPGETHNFWECLYVLEGEVLVSSDERIYNLSKGGLIFHKPLELHKFSVTRDQGAILLVFSFSAEGPLTGWLRNKVFALTENQRELVSHLLEYTESKITSSPQSDVAQRISHYLQPFHQLPYYSQLVSCYLHQLFLSLTEEGTISSVSSAADARTFRRAISYLNANLHRQPAVSEIARYCNISEASLKRLFEKYAGISVHKYLLKLKIKIAMELLEDHESVASVAEKLGFTSQSYFSKAFKRETGVSPSDVW